MKEDIAGGLTANPAVFPPQECRSEFVERRLDERFPLRSGVRVSWTDGANEVISMVAAGKNISASGAAFEIEIPLPLNLLVHLEFLNSRVLLSGHVRYSRKSGTVWRIGIEFTSPPPAPGA